LIIKTQASGCYVVVSRGIWRGGGVRLAQEPSVRGIKATEENGQDEELRESVDVLAEADIA
jgi:hypothetical protein